VDGWRNLFSAIASATEREIEFVNGIWYSLYQVDLFRRSHSAAQAKIGNCILICSLPRPSVGIRQEIAIHRPIKVIRGPSKKCQLSDKTGFIARFPRCLPGRLMQVQCRDDANSISADCHQPAGKARIFSLKSLQLLLLTCALCSKA
jgi:hypothetical protein